MICDQGGSDPVFCWASDVQPGLPSALFPPLEPSSPRCAPLRKPKEDNTRPNPCAFTSLSGPGLSITYETTYCSRHSLVHKPAQEPTRNVSVSPTPRPSPWRVAQALTPAWPARKPCQPRPCASSSPHRATENASLHSVSRRSSRLPRLGRHPTQPSPTPPPGSFTHLLSLGLAFLLLELRLDFLLSLGPD